MIPGIHCGIARRPATSSMTSHECPFLASRDAPNPRDGPHRSTVEIMRLRHFGHRANALPTAPSIPPSLRWPMVVDAELRRNFCPPVTGRAFSDGVEPSTPALHCAMNSLGLLTMNIGEPMTGIGMRASAAGSFAMDWEKGLATDKTAFHRRTASKNRIVRRSRPLGLYETAGDLLGVSLGRPWGFRAMPSPATANPV